MKIFKLVQDIYTLVLTKRAPPGVDVEKEIDAFGEAVKELMRKEFLSKSFDARKLRLSNIGRDDRYLWNHYHSKAKQKYRPENLIKFMYGHLIEEMLLFLTKMSGHEVTHEQHPCTVGDIKGSMDCKIDGIVTDVKSTSTYGFKKFKDGSLAYDDDFGYVAQIKAYAHSEGETKYGWLAMDKQNGHLTYLLYDEQDTQAPIYKTIAYSIEDRVKHINEVVQLKEPPKHCHEPIPDGKSGNLRLDTGCSYCHFKKVCWPGVRGFVYSNGPKFLVKVVNEPNVPEIPNEQIE